MAMIERALEQTIAYVRTRNAFGRPLIDNQTVQFTLAECKTDATVARVFANHCIERHLRGELDAATASMAKWWTTELQNTIVDRALQLHGGYGYMAEYPVARAFVNSRVSTIYGGTTEIQKEIIGRSLGL
jgi:acyl-CoA dehydrogenase